MQQASQQKPPTHLKVPLQTFGAMMNLLYTLPYAQVAEIIAALNQSEPLFVSESVDTTPGVTVNSGGPKLPTEQSNENRQRAEPESP